MMNRVSAALHGAQSTLYLLWRLLAQCYHAAIGKPLSRLAGRATKHVARHNAKVAARTHPARAAIHQSASLGEIIADAVAQLMGSWRFIIAQSAFVGLWILVNLVAVALRWDPYPFILLNLLFSTQAAYAAPIIMMSQNRQAQKDHLRDDREAQEVDQLFAINQQQLEILTLLRQLVKEEPAPSAVSTPPTPPIRTLLTPKAAPEEGTPTRMSTTIYPRVCVLGDSLATGRDASIVLNSFPRLVIGDTANGIPANALPALQQRNSANATSYLVHGVGGSTTGQMLANLQALGLVPATDLLIVELSTNDVGHSVPLAQFEQDSTALATYLLGASTKPLALVWLTPWYDPTFVNATGATAADYRDYLALTLAPQLRAQYPGVAVTTVDLGALCTTAGTHPLNTCTDTFHPNDYGHHLIAQAILAVI